MNKFTAEATAVLLSVALVANTHASSVHVFASAFPTEIYEEIITIISRDSVGGRGRVNLCRCALVCRLWLFWSQRCLYRVLDFSGEAANEFLQLKKLLRTLRDNPHLGAHVQAFRFGVASLPANRDYDTSRVSLVRLWPIMVAGKLPNLRDLGFAEGGFQDTFNPNASFFAPLTTFRAVRTLRLTMMGFSYVRFMRALSCLPSLEDVFIHKLSWNDLHRSFPLEPGYPRRPDLRKLRILDRSGLLFGFDCPYTATYARRLWQIMGSFRETIADLSLDAIAFYMLQEFSSELPGDFPEIRLPELRSLTLGYDFGPWFRHDPTTAGLLDLLHRLDMPCIHTVNLVLHINQQYLHDILTSPNSESSSVSPTTFPDPSPSFSSYSNDLASLRSLNILYLAYTQPNAPEERRESEAVNDSSASASNDAKNQLIYQYLNLQAPWISTTPLYKRGTLTIRGAELKWQHEFTPPRLAVTQWKYHISSERPTVSTLEQLEYDEDIVDVLLQL